MKLSDLKNKKVAVLGGGVEGVSSASYLVKHGARVSVLDKNTKLEPEFVGKIKESGADLILGPEYLDNLETFDIIVRSPGIKLSIVDNKVSKEKITSQTKLFFDLCTCQIIGVTGTKGKGTTSALIYEMLKKSGRDAYLGGNIGQPSLDFLDKLNAHSIVVLELSSFQLQDMNKSPHIAVLLMITSDHMAGSGDRNFHDSQDEYVAAKRQILIHQTNSDYAIINRDYPATHESDVYTNGKVYYVSREREVSEGCFAREGKIVLRIDGKDREIIKTTELLLRGEHNFENVCPSVIAAYLSGVSVEEIRAVLKSFKGLEHRLELVAEVNGIKYYDDSFSVNPSASIAAIEAFKEPEIIILGGSSKGADFTELGEVIKKKENIKAIIGIGVEWERMKKIFPMKDFKFPLIEGARDMKTIVAAASKIAEPGDVVLLSPACASFDMFKNYKDRGNQFKEEVLNLRNNLS